MEKLMSGLEWLKKNPYVPLVLLAGLLMLLLPSGEDSADAAPAEEPAGLSAPDFSLEAEEERLRAALESIAGVGRAGVLLSLERTAERELISGADGAVVVSAGSGREEAVDRAYEYPRYLGAVVVCDGGGDAAVRLAVTEAVSAFTGLGTGRIQVLQMEE